MNIVFFGSSNFAAVPLRALLTTAHNISCVVTQPDKRKGRGLHFAGTIIKTIAQESKLDIYQPDNVNCADSAEFFKCLDPDLFIVIAYGQILSQKILDIPRIMPVNIHASLLPKYRGAAPINWAIINGEKTTGITIIKMTSKMDAGPIIIQKEMKISDDDNALTLEHKLSESAGESLLPVISSIETDSYNLNPQGLENATFASKLKKENGLIDWKKPVQVIQNLIKGCLGWPGAFTYYKGKILKIYKTRVIMLPCVSESTEAGKIIDISKEGIIVGTGAGNLMIEELQIEGSRRMKVEEFIAGHKIGAREKFGLKK